MRAPRLLIPLLFVGACAGDDATTGPPAALLGTWRAVPSAFDTSPPAAADRRTYTFEADGTQRYAEGPLRVTASYEVSGDQLTLDELGVIKTSTYLTTPTRLMLDVLTRAEGAGLIGTWQQRRTVDGKVRDVVLVLRADQGARYAMTVDGAPAVDEEATWARMGDDLDVALVSQPGSGLRVTLLDDRLGTPYERL